jgi:hypothetical protein
VTRTDFQRLPDDARLWTFGVERALEPREEELLLEEVDAFLEGWAAHGAPLTAGRSWRHGRFLLVAVDEASVPPSGCSIDALVHRLKAVEAELGVTLVDNSPVWYREGETVHRVSRTEFARRAEAGEVDRDTVVFDPTVTRLGQLRGGSWETPARDAWHARAFFRDG